MYLPTIGRALCIYLLLAEPFNKYSSQKIYEIFNWLPTCSAMWFAITTLHSIGSEIVNWGLLFRQTCPLIFTKNLASLEHLHYFSSLMSFTLVPVSKKNTRLIGRPAATVTTMLCLSILIDWLAVNDLSEEWDINIDHNIVHSDSFNSFRIVSEAR